MPVARLASASGSQAIKCSRKALGAFLKSRGFRKMPNGYYLKPGYGAVSLTGSGKDLKTAARHLAPQLGLKPGQVMQQIRGLNVSI